MNRREFIHLLGVTAAATTASTILADTAEPVILTLETPKAILDKHPIETPMERVSKYQIAWKKDLMTIHLTYRVRGPQDMNDRMRVLLPEISHLTWRVSHVVSDAYPYMTVFGGCNP